MWIFSLPHFTLTAKWKITKPRIELGEVTRTFVTKDFGIGFPSMMLAVIVMRHPSLNWKPGATRPEKTLRGGIGSATINFHTTPVNSDLLDFYNCLALLIPNWLVIATLLRHHDTHSYLIYRLGSNGITHCLLRCLALHQNFRTPNRCCTILANICHSWLRPGFFPSQIACHQPIFSKPATIANWSTYPFSSHHPGRASGGWHRGEIYDVSLGKNRGLI